ncbi:MAG: replication initiation protein [Anaerohalosphaeraceae bacterium]|nr:replication initiation protein [Anaerohalosphaeraceae bacterium]
MEKQLKQDINFLEYPLWFQNSKMAKLRDDGYVWRDRKGFVFRTGYNPPTRTDYIFLCYLLLKCQESNWKEEIELTRYEVLKACDLNKGLKNYNRLENSLTRWNMVGLEFRGIFYDGVEYQIIQFGIIDDWDIEKQTKRLRVRFNPKWLLCIKQSRFFQFIEFEDIKNLNSPLALRLYELLIKAFRGRDTWEINALKLAVKIPMAQKYPSDILPKIRIALDQINKNTSIKIFMTVRQPERGRAIIAFHKDKKQINQVNDEKFSPVLIPEELISLISEEHCSDKARKLIAYWLDEKDIDYVKRNIIYTNQHSNKKDGYCGYLARALEQDWGVDMVKRTKNAADNVKTDIPIKYKNQHLTIDGQTGCIFFPNACMPAGIVTKLLKTGEITRDGLTGI